MSDSAHDIGWATKPKDDPSVLALREQLIANNGIKGLDVVSPSDIEQAVTLFRRDGFVVVADVLNSEQTEFLAHGCDQAIAEIIALDNDYGGNRGTHRYSFGGSSLTRSQLHRPEWQMLLDIPVVHRLVAAIFGSEDYSLRAASGDFCLPGAVYYQPLHSDIRDFVDAKQTPFSAFIDPTNAMSIRDLPCPYVCVNFLPQELTPLNGPTRQIPGTQNARQAIPSLKEEPEWMRLSTVCPAPAGGILLRDVRAWHDGMPNLSDVTRSIPNLEFYAPWFREPMVPGISYKDYKKLSDHAQKLARFCVADSSDELITGATLRAP